jgi:hypothetical protein
MSPYWLAGPMTGTLSGLATLNIADPSDNIVHSSVGWIHPHQGRLLALNQSSSFYAEQKICLQKQLINFFQTKKRFSLDFASSCFLALGYF